MAHADGRAANATVLLCLVCYAESVRSQTGRGAFVWAVLAPALVWGQTRAAAETGLGLSWNDPLRLSPGGRSAFEARLSERLGRPAFLAAGEADETLSVRWEGTPKQCRVELQLLRRLKVEGTRRLESPSGDCPSLGPALLTVAALLIESREASMHPAPGASEPPSVEPSPELPAESPPELPPEPPPELPSEPSPELLPEPSPAPLPAPAVARQEPSVLLSLGVRVSAGFAPQFEFGPAGALVVSPVQGLRVGLLGSYSFPREYGVSPGLELAHGSIGPLACGMPLTGALALGLCAGATLHHFSSTGVGLPQPRSGSASVWSVGVAGRAEWRLAERLSWVGGLGGDVSLTPLYFYFQPTQGGEMVLFRQARFTSTLFVGLTLELT